MADRYISHGKPLTDEEREVLTVLMEEAAEVIQAGSKILRFGKEETPRREGVKTNVVVFSEEIGDLNTMMDLATELGLIDIVAQIEGEHRKTERFDKYRQSEPSGVIGP